MKRKPSRTISLAIIALFLLWMTGEAIHAIIVELKEEQRVKFENLPSMDLYQIAHKKALDEINQMKEDNRP